MGLTFGRKYSDAPAPTGGSGKWIKALKEGETKIRFLQEIKDWVVYYEHYNPAGSAFPCTGDRESCPGCTSSIERMKQASRKNAVNAVVGGYVDVYKLPVKLTNRLVIRSERNGGTITDRDYLITRVGKDKDTEYDLEALSPKPFDYSMHQLNDIEKMLAEQFAENFPDFDASGETGSQERPTRQKNGSTASVSGPTENWDAPGLSGHPEPPPFENPHAPKADPPVTTEAINDGAVEVEITEAELRSMDKDSLISLMQREEIEYGPSINEDSVDQIVDWLLEHA